MTKFDGKKKRTSVDMYGASNEPISPESWAIPKNVFRNDVGASSLAKSGSDVHTIESNIFAHSGKIIFTAPFPE